MYVLYKKSSTHIAYSDLIVRFPYRSSRGDEYIMVGYHYDVNAISVELVKIDKQVHSLLIGQYLVKSSKIRG